MKRNLVSIRDYLRIIFRRKYALMIPILLSLLLTVPLWLIVPIKYRAAAVFQRKELLAANRGNPNQARQSLPSISTLRVQILAYRNLDYVIEKAHLLNAASNTPAADRQRKYKDLQSAITVRPLSSSEDRGVDIIEVAVVDASPDRAWEIANGLADKYIESSMSQGRQALERDRKFYQDHAKESQDKLETVEAELDKFVRLHYEQLPKVKEGISAKLADLATRRSVLEGQIAGVTRALAENERQLEEVKKTIKGTVPNEANPEAIRLQGQIDQRQKELDALLLARTEMHPDVIRVRKDLAALKAQLASLPERPESEREIVNPMFQNLSNARFNKQQELNSLKASLEPLLLEIAANEANMKEIVNKDEPRYLDLERHKKMYEEDYASYTKAYSETVAKLAATSGNYGAELEFVNRADRPAIPYKLDRLIIALTCLAGGIAFGVMLMFIVEFADHSLRSVEDAAGFLDVPILGSVSEIVPPQQAAQHRRVWFYVGMGAAAFVVVVTLALVLWEFVSPGALKQAVMKISEKYFK